MMDLRSANYRSLLFKIKNRRQTYAYHINTENFKGKTLCGCTRPKPFSKYPMHDDSSYYSQERSHQHISEKMLPQVDPGIPYGDGGQQIDDIPFFILLENSQHGGEGEYGGGMTGRKAAKAAARYAVDKISIFSPMLKYFPGTRHGKNILQDLGQQGREKKGYEHLPGLGPSTHYHQQDNHRHGKKPIPQIGKGNEKIIQQGWMKRVQQQETGRFALRQQKYQPHEEKEPITEKKIAVGHND